MGNTNRKLLLISLILAMLTTLVVYRYLIQSDVKTSLPSDSKVYSYVLIAVEDIPVGTKIKPEMLTKVSIDSVRIQENAISELEDIEEKFTIENIYKNEQILKSRVINDEEKRIIYNIPKGKRAVSINVNEVIGVSNLIMPGDYVDVIVTYEEVKVGQVIIHPKITKIALQNIMVLNTGNKPNYVKTSETEMPNTITLAVTPEESEKLVYSDHTGMVRLSLRPAMEENIIQVPGVIRETFTPLTPNTP